MEPVADRTPSLSRPPPNLAVSAGARGPEKGDPEMEETAHREMVTAPLPPPEEGWVDNILFRFVSVPLLAQQPAVPKTSIKEQFPQSLGLKRRRVVNRASRDHFPPPLSPGGRWLPKSTPPAHSWNQVRAVALQSPLQIITRRAVTSLKPGSCVSFRTRRNQVSVTLHTQTPPPAVTGQAVTGSLFSTTLPLRGYVCGSAGTVSRSLVSAPRSVSVAPADHQTRLRDSVRPASPQVQGCPLHFSESCRCPCPVCGNRSPAGEGCDITGPSSRYEVGVLQPLLHCAQEKRWVTTDLGSASFEPCTSQAAVQDDDAETHFRVRPSPRLVCSDRPEGRILSCLDPPATQAIPAIRVRGLGISVQGPALRAVPVASCLHQSRGGGPCSPERTGCIISFLGMELDSVNQTARLTQERAQSVLNCLKTLSGRTAVPLKLFQRLLGHMAAAAAIVPLGLLHMRPLQHWLHGRIPRWAWKRGTHRVQITLACCKTFSPWSDPSFLWAGVPLEQVSRHAVVFTDASPPAGEPRTTGTQC